MTQFKEQQETTPMPLALNNDDLTKLYDDDNYTAYTEDLEFMWRWTIYRDNQISPGRLFIIRRFLTACGQPRPGIFQYLCKKGTDRGGELLMANHQIKILTEEGQSVTFDCAPGEDIISAAIRQSIYLMSSCREGGCATCKGFCSEGDYELGKISSQALPSEEEEDGFVLLCRCYPTDDMEVEVPYTFDRISYTEEGKEFATEIVALEKISSNVMKLCLGRWKEIIIQTK